MRRNLLYEQADVEKAGKAVHGQFHPREDTRSLYLRERTPPVRQRLRPAVRRTGGAFLETTGVLGWCTVDAEDENEETGDMG